MESLIISHGEAGSFIEEPAFHVNAELFADGATERSAAVTGQQIGSYRIIRELGRGGMGAVYLAEELNRRETITADPPKSVRRTSSLI